MYPFMVYNTKCIYARAGQIMISDNFQCTAYAHFS